MIRFAIFLVKLYQKTLSPRTGFFSFIYFSPIFNLNFGTPLGCKHQKSCSDYSIESFTQYGFSKGLKLSLIRIYNCR